jgi:hypothetical protein
MPLHCKSVLSSRPASGTVHAWLDVFTLLIPLLQAGASCIPLPATSMSAGLVVLIMSLPLRSSFITALTQNCLVLLALALRAWCCSAAGSADPAALLLAFGCSPSWWGPLSDRLRELLRGLAVPHRHAVQHIGSQPGGRSPGAWCRRGHGVVVMRLRLAR